jgi:hypothetical protein
MTRAIQIPAVGESGVGPPHGIMSEHFTVGFATTNDVVITATGNYTLASVVVTGPEDSIIVHDIKTQVTTAFTTSVVFTLGDSDDVDGYGTDTLINPAATGAAFKKAATAYAEGKKYTAAQTIDIPVSGTPVLAGVMEVLIQYSRGR